MCVIFYNKSIKDRLEHSIDHKRYIKDKISIFTRTQIFKHKGRNKNTIQNIT